MITRISTRKQSAGTFAFQIVVDGFEFELNYSDIKTPGNPSGTIVDNADLQAAVEAALGRLLGDSVFIHINRDESIAVALSEEPTVWPEDR
jgi:histidinol-phosphate/aromatic aminotransferase/cobyric acid decarboxylase-like protein